jgi:phosphoglycolate phosphatase-like HAD superfamily hydrolase
VNAGLNGTPDLVVFDVDGTVHDTFRWWAPIIRQGLREFGSRAGIPIEDPSDEMACSVVGMRDAGVWAPFLPDEHKHRWNDLRSVVLPLEIDELRSGRDHLFAGVRDLIARLRSAGIHVALASNCRQPYMDAIREGQGLAAATDWQFCLDSPGVDTKTDMLRRAAEASAARNPVMVGDREPDLEAAREIGWPFVWRRNERCDLAAVSDATWSGGVAEFLALIGLPSGADGAERGEDGV